MAAASCLASIRFKTQRISRGECKQTLASAGYALLGLHAAAALYHHFHLRDNSLRLMLPARRG